MSKILQRQTVIIHREVDANDSTFSFNLGLNFVPTSVILRSLNFGKTDATPDNYVNGVILPWTNGEIGCAFVYAGNSPIFSNPGTIFDLSKKGSSLVNGDVNFTIVKLTDTEEASGVIGVLALTFEFIQEDIQLPKPKTTDIDKLINFLKTEKASRDIYPFNPVQSQTGRGHGCMCGGQAVTEDQRNALNQTDPIPDVIDMSEGQEPVEEPTEEGKEEKKQEEGKEEKKQEGGQLSSREAEDLLKKLLKKPDDDVEIQLNQQIRQRYPEVAQIEQFIRSNPGMSYDIADIISQFLEYRPTLKRNLPPAPKKPRRDRSPPQSPPRSIRRLLEG